MTLLPWQQWFLIHALELNEDGTFRFKRVMLLVSRQNGKTTLIKALILWRLFVDGARTVIGAAQSLGDAEDVWEDVVTQAENVPALRKRMHKPKRVNGAKAMRLRSGGRYIVETLERDAGRGKTADLLFLDELREHKSWDAWNALSSTTLVPPRAQTVCASNAGDVHSVVLRDLRGRAKTAIDTRMTDEVTLGLFEWSAPDGCDIDDWSARAQANPSLGYTLTPAALQADRETKTENGFRTENLCQEVEQIQTGIIDAADWSALRDGRSRRAPGARIGVAVDVSWDRSRAHIGIAVEREDGIEHVEVIASRAGTAWVIPWLVERFDAEGGWFDGRVAIQERGAPVSSLADGMTESGLTVVPCGGAELSKSAGLFYDRIRQQTVRHLGQPVLDEAARAARARSAGDAWFFDRKGSPSDVAPLIAVSEASWLLRQAIEVPRVSAYETTDFIML
ncbi:terminase large subunit domain-containing protein [Rhodococcus sp. AG1013]|uniref:terminase large subunit domain-containing protein n=1 Tax=Rhodococcus sp. AG1013 TaxID=2183996 RepID=UPI0015F03AD0|nr:terminase family protein [Rhodococcus sp. AG1013]